MLTETKKLKSQNIPKLRFPGFSDEWKEKKLGNIGEIITGKTPQTSNRNFYGGDYLFVSPADFNGQRHITKTKTTCTKAGFNQVKSIKTGSVLFVCIGSTIGKIAQAEKDCITNQQINSFISNDKNSDDFIYFNLLKRANKIKLLAGKQAIPIINKTQFEGIKIKLPVLIEQKKIAEFLGATDEWIENLKKQKESIELYKKGITQKLFSQEIRFPEFSNSWQERKLGKVATFWKGKGISKSDIVKNGKNKCIRYGELYTEYKEVIKNVVSYTNNPKEKSLLSKKNDVLMPTSDVTPNGLARVSALNQSKVILGGDILVIRSTEILNIFFSYYVRAHKRDIMRLVSGVTVYHIYGSDLKNMRISFPSIQEQKKIADFLTSVDRMIESKQQQITQAQIWEKGLMQEMFV